MRAKHRLVAALAACLLIATVGATTAGAGASPMFGPTMLKVSGDHTGAADVSIAKRLKLVIFPDEHAKGTYAALVIQQLPSRKPLYFALYLPKSGFGTGFFGSVAAREAGVPAVPMQQWHTVDGQNMSPDPSSRFELPTITLRPGNYRITLLTDGPATFGLHGSGRDHALVVHPTSKPSIDANYATSSLPAGAPAALTRTTVRAHDMKLGVVIGMTDSTGVEASYSDACLSTKQLCETDSDWGPGQPFVYPHAGRSGEVYMLIVAGHVPDGTYNAVYDYASAGSTTSSSVFALAIQ